MNKFVVVWEQDGTQGERGGFTSPEEAEKWVTNNLPYGVQKCRDGSYEIIEDDYLSK